MKLKSFIHCGVLAAGLSVIPGNLRADEANEPGAVFTMDNAASGNHVLVYHRSTDGTLSAAGSVATGGLGAGQGLGSQGALALTQNGHWLFVCNAGSSDISVFLVTPTGLVLTDQENSQGKNPISLTVHGNLLFVLNAGGLVNDQDLIAGFVFVDGKLYPAPGSIHSLSATNTNPAQISFSPDGQTLAVTEKDTSIIDTFTVDNDGSIDTAQQFASSGQEPFGFAFDGDDLIVSEAFGGAADASAASSYEMADDGSLAVISPSVSTKQTAACWVATTDNGKYAYTANTGSGTVSGYRITHDGVLTLLNASGVAGIAGSGAADMALSRGSRYLYTRNGGDGTLSAFRVNADGSLQSIRGVSGLPAASTGLAAN